jgi:DNA-binding NarL/FixJ family response regulator
MGTIPQILLIDDDRAWLETLSEYLQTKGFATRTSDDPARGLKLLEDSAITLAVIDYHMPGMNGLELLRRLREHRPQVTVFLLSNAEEPFLAQRALAEGARAFLSKAAAPRLLARLVQDFFRESSFRDAESPRGAAPTFPLLGLRRPSATLALTFRRSDRTPLALLPRPR